MRWTLHRDDAREDIKRELLAHGAVEKAGPALGVSERTLYHLLGEDEALREWWRAEQTKKGAGQ